MSYGQIGLLPPVTCTETYWRYLEPTKESQLLLRYLPSYSSLANRTYPFPTQWLQEITSIPLFWVSISVWRLQIWIQPYASHEHSHSFVAHIPIPIFVEYTRTKSSVVSGGLSDSLVLPDSTNLEAEGSIYALTLVDRWKDQNIHEADLSELYCVAAGQPTSAIHTSYERVYSLASTRKSLSKSWTMLTLHHGAVFQLHCPIDDPYRSTAQILFKTIYTDAFMLARLQDSLVRKWENETADLLRKVSHAKGPSSSIDSLRDLDRRTLVNSTRYWIRHCYGNTGRSVELLKLARDTMGITDRFSAVLNQVKDLTDLATRDLHLQNEENQKAIEKQQNRLSQLIELLGAILLPATICMEAFQLLQYSITRSNISILISIILASSLFLWWLLRYVSKHPRGNTRHPE